MFPLLFLAWAPAVASSSADSRTQCPSGYAVQDKCVPLGISPLDFWVNKYDDGVYKYDPEPLQVLPFGNATAFVLNMTSQRWLLDEVFEPASAVQSLWHHQVIVIVPHAIKSAVSRTGWLWITGGQNEANGDFKPIPTDPKSSDRGELEFSAKMAIATGTVSVVLKQVPNQPIKFKKELPGKYSGYTRVYLLLTSI